MPVLQLKSLRRLLTIPLSVMILFAFVIASAQAATSSCQSARSAIGKIEARDAIVTANPDGDHGALPDRAPVQAKLDCCSFSCPTGFMAVESPSALLVLQRQAVAALSDQSPETLAGDGLKRPPKSILTASRHA